MRRLLPGAALLLSGLLTATLLTPTPELSVPRADAAVPDLAVSTVVSGLDQPWDVQPLPDGSLLVTERTTRRLLRVAPGGSTATPVAFPRSSVWASGETGLMGLAVDPGFASNRRFYTCQGGFNSATSSKRDVRVVSWRLSADSASATQSQVLLRGIPARTGRHGGCRLLLHSQGWLLVGTGDAAVGTNPRSLTSLGGKVLRINRLTGAPWPSNPYARASNLNKRKIYSYGHRNVQGLAERPGGGIWSAEHGPSRDDEVNRLVPGGDNGWHPVPGYNERRPMTDFGLPGVQQRARWTSGAGTIATSGATFIRGAAWGDLEGTLAVAALKGERVVFLRFGAQGNLAGSQTPAELRRYGRLRSVTQLGNGDLLVTTANGGNDRVLRVRPVA